MTVHVIGAGIAGLAAAARLARAGVTVALYEQTRAAGGRCRSYFDARFGRPLDTGIHLTFARSRHFQAFLADVDAADQLVGPDVSYCRFFDAVEGRSWTLRPNSGPVPWWLVVPGRSPPRKGVGDLLGLARLAVADRASTVSACIPTSGPSYRSLWEPITVACLNTPPAEASAQLLWQFILDGFRHGAALYHQRFARGGLSESFIAPALAKIEARHGTVHFRTRAHRFEFAGRRVDGLHVGGRRIALASSDAVVLALPPAAAARIVPDLSVPRRCSAIVTVHFALDPPAPPGPDLTCVIEGRSFWLLTRDRVATATIGAADDLLGEAPASLAQRLWSAAAAALGRDAERLPPYRVLKFRDGTYAHTPSEIARRPSTRTRWANLFVAGDWTATEFPATVDSAALSGHRAAAAAQEAIGRT
ncbi:MAG: FAD-dependent oxidoreductase [Alphaproteobacteria bacterium]|nr:FAD-dependent oxidoreductase [Alphaproteobacteria bacterium]